MLAFHGDPALKRDVQARLARHIAAGTLLLGDTRWDGTSGSPVGVAVEAADADAYSAAFGYPLPLVGLLDPLTEMLGDQSGSFAFVIDWVDAVEPGAGLAHVPTRVMLHMLETAETDSAVGPLKQALLELHQRDLGNETPTRAEWSALRNSISKAQEAAGDDYGQLAHLTVLDAASWPAARGHTPLSATFGACLNLVAMQPDPDWGDADNQRCDTFFMAMEAELSPLIQANEDIDFNAIASEREPDLMRRYAAYSDRYHARMGDRASSIATACIDYLRQAAVITREPELG